MRLSIPVFPWQTKHHCASQHSSSCAVLWLQRLAVHCIASIDRSHRDATMEVQSIRSVPLFKLAFHKLSHTLKKDRKKAQPSGFRTCEANYFVFLCKSLIIITAMRDSLICCFAKILGDLSTFLANGMYWRAAAFNLVLHLGRTKLLDTLDRWNAGLSWTWSLALWSLRDLLDGRSPVDPQLCCLEHHRRWFRRVGGESVGDWHQKFP